MNSQLPSYFILKYNHKSTTDKPRKEDIKNKTLTDFTVTMKREA